MWTGEDALDDDVSSPFLGVAGTREGFVFGEGDCT